jgi:CRP-like cAMP-binding protein
VPRVSDELKRVPLFSGLNQRQLKQLAGRFRERELKAGTAVVQEQKMSGVGFFVITEGEAAVSVGGKEVGKIGPGDHFGELALISESERTATVTAVTTLRCLEIPFWDFREFAMANPDVTWKLLEHVVRILSATTPKTGLSSFSPRAASDSRGHAGTR